MDTGLAWIRLTRPLEHGNSVGRNGTGSERDGFTDHLHKEMRLNMTASRVGANPRSDIIRHGAKAAPCTLTTEYFLVCGV